MVTYFLCTDKRGIDYFRITGKVLRSYLRGFRAVVVTTEPIVGVVSPDLKWIEVVGQVWGDHFRFGRQWAKRDILQELEAEYLQGGAGTHSQRRKAIEDYERAVAALEAHRESIAALKRNLSEASANLVRRVGRGEVELCGKLCGPSYRRDTVFWRPQPESDAKSVVVVEAEPEQEVFERLSQEAAEG